MTYSIFHLLRLFLLIVSSWPLCCLCQGGTFTLDIHHRFSDEVKRWVESTPHKDAIGNVWPEKGSLHYYVSLYDHDKAHLHRRGLAGGRSILLTFEHGNHTVSPTKLGFLHYTFISLGTPGVKFLIALDTGSSLLWVPCSGCTRCSPSNKEEDLNMTFNFYNSSLSSTSKKVPCSSSFCERQLFCTNPSETCTYKVQYLDDSSTSGVLVEDVLRLITVNTTDHRQQQHQAVNIDVTFGCGQNQAGTTSDSGIPNGILGLGTRKVSVPSILASKGLAADSFSMCFGLHHKNGRINFGDKGSTDQKETPVLFTSNGHYVVNVTGIELERTVVTNRSLNPIVDTGAALTWFPDPIYTDLAEAFHSQVQKENPLHPQTPDFPLKYCYTIRPDQTSILVPQIRLKMKGGSYFDVLSPILLVKLNENEYMFCLAILKSEDFSIIGQNFMEGYRLVFDRERQILGWKEFDCYSVDENPINSSSTFSSYTSQRKRSSSPPPSSSSSSSSTSQQRNGHLSSFLGLSWLFFTTIVTLWVEW